MKIIDLLDRYIDEGSVSEIDDSLLNLILSKSPSLVFGVLVSFKNKNCDFSPPSVVPITYGEAREFIKNPGLSLSEKYIYALYCLKYQHHITSDLVTTILEKLEV